MSSIADRQERKLEMARGEVRDLTEKWETERRCNDRIVAERDAWMSIAREMLAVAHDLTPAQAAQFTLPPVELVSPGWSSPEAISTALKNWWVRVTRDDINECPNCGADRYFTLHE